MSVFYWVLAFWSAFVLLVSIAEPAWLKREAKKEKTPTGRVVGFVLSASYVFAMTYAALNIGGQS